MIPNMYHIQLTLCMSYRAKTGNNVSEFMHLNCITLSYYSSPKHKSLIPKCHRASWGSAVRCEIRDCVEIITITADLFD